MSRRQKFTNRRKPAPNRARDYRVPIGLSFLAVLLIGGATLLWQTNSHGSVSPPEVRGMPRVAVTPETIDYGDVKLDTSIRSVFHVSNIGDEPLQILGEPEVELIRGC